MKMSLSYHNVLHPNPCIAGLLVTDEDGFDYVPLVGVPRGESFAKTLQGALDAGTHPQRILRYFFDKGGPHLYESLSIREPVEGASRLGVIRSLAAQKGWEMHWTVAPKAPQSDPQTEDATPPSEAPLREASQDPPLSEIAFDQGEPPFPGLPRSLKQAMVMQTLAVLIRRHHASMGLRLVEMHPCGGMYDCLALAQDRLDHSLCLFNLAGTGLLLNSVGTPRPINDVSPEWHDSVWRYPRGYFAWGGPEGFADQIEARLGLPKCQALPSASASTVSVAVMAQLAQRFALSERAPTFRCAWLDTSGMEGSSIRPWIKAFPKLKARCDAQSSDWSVAARVACRVWGIGSERHFDRPAVTLDLGTGEVRRQGRREGSLWGRYAKGAGIRELAWWLEGLWRNKSAGA
jgi:hypothetical protein